MTCTQLQVVLVSNEGHAILGKLKKTVHLVLLDRLSRQLKTVSHLCQQ
jgi:hypothetical protein